PLTVTGKSIEENLKGKKTINPEVIRPLEKPYHATGGLAVLFGNLAPEGAVIKQSAVDEAMLKHRGPARVFDSEEEAIKIILDRKIKKGEVVVIRYEGPKGGPGMREMLAPTSAIVGVGRDRDVALLTDGLLISKEELKRRLSKWKPPKKKLRGYLKRYARLVTSANTGATFVD
ncbi:MAG: dihydroxy-acid dehydratase, partial [Thermodesulfobacteriota bacterium]